MATNRKIVWTGTSIKQFNAAITYIASDSIINSEKISREIINELNKTLKNPFLLINTNRIMMAATGLSKNIATK